jgi:hypothetical protein
MWSRHIVMSIHGSRLKFSFGDHVIGFIRARGRVNQCANWLCSGKYGDLIFWLMDTAEDARRTAAKSVGVHVDAGANWGQCVEAVFAEKVEPGLIRPDSRD